MTSLTTITTSPTRVGSTVGVQVCGKFMVFARKGQDHGTLSGFGPGHQNRIEPKPENTKLSLSRDGNCM